MKLSFSVAVAMMIPFACLNARAGWFSFYTVADPFALRMVLVAAGRTILHGRNLKTWQENIRKVEGGRYA